MSEYVFTVLFFSHEFYPRCTDIYGGSRKPTVKHGKLCPRESDFSEEFEVTRLNEALSRDCILRSESSLDSEFCGALFQFG